MIRLHSEFPSNWKKCPDQGSTLRAEAYGREPSSVIFTVQDYNNNAIGIARINVDSAEKLRDFLSDFISRESARAST